MLLSLLKRPVVWLAGIGLVLLLVLAFWYVKRPTDASGQSLILSRSAQKKLDKDLQRRATQRAQDSVRAAQTQASATTLYQQGQQQEANAIRLHQQTHENRLSPADTSAQRLQRELSTY